MAFYRLEPFPDKMPVCIAIGYCSNAVFVSGREYGDPEVGGWTPPPGKSQVA